MEHDTASRDKLWSMIKQYKFAMLTTLQEGDVLRSRPMTTVEKDFDGTLWFFAAADSAAASALGVHPQVALSYGDSNAHDFVSVAGLGSVVTDVGKKKELWNAGVQAWFPEGAESPHVVLIKVAADHAEYWDSKSNKLVQLFSMAKALATGKPPRDIGEHHDVTLPGSSTRAGTSV